MTLQYTKIQQEKFLKENPLPSPYEKRKLNTMQCTMYIYNGQCSDICWGLGAAGRDNGKTAGGKQAVPLTSKLGPAVTRQRRLQPR